MKRQAADWERMFVNRISDRRLVSRIYKELPKLNTKNNQTSTGNATQYSVMAYIGKESKKKKGWIYVSIFV